MAVKTQCRYGLSCHWQCDSDGHTPPRRAGRWVPLSGAQAGVALSGHSGHVLAPCQGLMSGLALASAAAALCAQLALWHFRLGLGVKLEYSG
jgi:hypothetical protein